MQRSRMRSDIKVYRQAIAALEACVLHAEPWNSFDRAVQRAEGARRAFQAARARLERHLAQHGCDGQYWRPEKLVS